MPADEPTDNDWSQITHQNFADLWNAVLSGDEDAVAATLQMVREAVVPMLRKSFPGLDAQEVAASVQGTVLRNLLVDSAQLNADNLARFFANVRARARYKAYKRIKLLRREAQFSAPNEQPDDEPRAAEEQLVDTGKSPLQIALENDFADALLRILEERGDPDQTIVLGFIHQVPDADIARELNLSEAAVRMRRTRAIKDIRRVLENAE